MKNPKMFGRVIVGSNPYRLYNVDHISGKKGQNIWGQCDPLRNRILIRRGLGSNRTETIMHELVHAVGQEYSLNLSETQVECLGKELCGVMRQLNLLKDNK